jgi:hypothetical protein
MFKDFFKPPPKPFYSRGDKSNAQSKSVPRKKAMDMDGFEDLEVEKETGSDLDDGEEEAENDDEEPKVKDLFDDDDDREEGGKSAHEKRLERINQQIEELEMANVGPKDWTLGGEVRYGSYLLASPLSASHPIARTRRLPKPVLLTVCSKRILSSIMLPRYTSELSNVVINQQTIHDFSSLYSLYLL